MEYLRRNHKLIQSKENGDLIDSTLPLLFKKKYELAFYLIIFLENFASPHVYRQLIHFKPDKITLTNIKDQQVNQMTRILQRLEKNPNKVLENIKYDDKKREEKTRDESGIKLYALILVFNYYHTDRLGEILSNKDEKSLYYIYKALLSFKPILKNLKLDKKIITSLIQTSDKKSEFFDALDYSENIMDLLQIIDENIEKVNGFSEEGEIKIDIESIISPKKSDKFEKIMELYKKLEKELNKNIKLIFSDQLFINYIDFFKGENYDELILIKKLLNLLQKKGEKMKIDEAIHTTGLKFANDKKFNNVQILDFMINDKFYNDKSANKDLTIFTGINIETINEEFYKKWNEIKWKDLFQNQYKEFINIITNLIGDMKYFDVLVKLLFKLMISTILL